MQNLGPRYVRIYVLVLARQESCKKGEERKGKCTVKVPQRIVQFNHHLHIFSMVHFSSQSETFVRNYEAFVFIFLFFCFSGMLFQL